MSGVIARHRQRDAGTRKSFACWSPPKACPSLLPYLPTSTERIDYDSRQCRRACEQPNRQPSMPSFSFPDFFLEGERSLARRTLCRDSKDLTRTDESRQFAGSIGSLGRPDSRGQKPTEPRVVCLCASAASTECPTKTA